MIDLSEFKVYEKGNSTPLLVATVTAKKCISVGVALSKEIGAEKVRVMAKRDGSVLVFMPDDGDKAFALCKNGEIRATELTRDLQAAGVLFPARYVFERQDGYLVGTLQPHAEVTPRADKAAERPRRAGLYDMMPA